jgi:hypothetical protein
MHSNREMTRNRWMTVWIVSLVILVGWYIGATGLQRGRSAEGYADYLAGSVAGPAPDGVAPEVADFGQNTAILGDMLQVSSGLTAYEASGVAAVNADRQLELGGQYVQRTNNYRRTYPDNGSAPLSELVGSVYSPIAVGATVPCDGQC